MTGDTDTRLIIKEIIKTGTIATINYIGCTMRLVWINTTFAFIWLRRWTSCTGIMTELTNCWKTIVGIALSFLTETLSCYILVRLFNKCAKLIIFITIKTIIWRIAILTGFASIVTLGTNLRLAIFKKARLAETVIVITLINLLLYTIKCIKRCWTA